MEIDRSLCPRCEQHIAYGCGCDNHELLEVMVDPRDYAASQAEIAGLTAERDTARAETAMAFEAAKDAIINALDMQGAQMAGRYDQNKLDFNAVNALTSADVTAALEARDKATRNRALLEASELARRGMGGIFSSMRCCDSAYDELADMILALASK